ncbi:(S)-8-oxocitronellyl enol synthase [Euphorbia peplus]|nr:(S)-8-oxocitronellyl enol synthase [Euphorbia peplus]
METGSSERPPFVALIVGVTGMAGLSLAEALKNPAISGTDRAWKVYGIARSTELPVWFPSSLLDGFISVDVLDQHNTSEKLMPLSSQITHIFWVALQVCENEEANITTNSKMLTNVLDVMKSAGSSSRLKHITLQTGTKHYMGPIHDPDIGNEVLVLDRNPPFRECLPRLPYPNFYYALEDLVGSYIPSVTYSVHRSSIIIGASTKSFYNILLILSVYATICRFKGLPFKYPGTKYTWEHFCDMSDSGLLAEQQIWAAMSDEEENDKFDWADMMRGNCEVWDEIVEKYGLFRTKMDEVICYDALNAILHFEFQNVCSMNKSREFGFHGFRDTFKSVGLWVKRLKDLKIIP